LQAVCLQSQFVSKAYDTYIWCRSLEGRSLSLLGTSSKSQRLPIGQVGYPARRRIAAQSMSTSQVSTPSNKISTIGRTSTPHIRSSRATWNSRLSTELASGSSDCGSREGVKPSANTVQTRSEKPCRIGPRGRKLQGWVLSLRPFGFLLLPAAQKRNTRSPRHLAACLRAICG
jgi:hypothetical protein